MERTEGAEKIIEYIEFKLKKSKRNRIQLDRIMVESIKEFLEWFISYEMEAGK